MDATEQIRATASTLQQGTVPETDGTLSLQGGGRLSFDNVDFGDSPKRLATLRLAATPSTPGASLSLRFDDTPAPAAVLTVEASTEPQTVQIPLPDGQTGVHTLQIDATCPEPGPCVSLSTVTFS